LFLETYSQTKYNTLRLNGIIIGSHHGAVALLLGSDWDAQLVFIIGIETILTISPPK
jgi:hypothetical protein